MFFLNDAEGLARLQRNSIQVSIPAGQRTIWGCAPSRLCFLPCPAQPGDMHGSRDIIHVTYQRLRVTHRLHRGLLKQFLLGPIRKISAPATAREVRLLTSGRPLPFGPANARECGRPRLLTTDVASLAKSEKSAPPWEPILPSRLIEKRPKQYSRRQFLTNRTATRSDFT